MVFVLCVQRCALFEGASLRQLSVQCYLESMSNAAKKTVYTVDYATLGGTQFGHTKDFASKQEAWSFIKGLLIAGDILDLSVYGDVVANKRLQTQFFLAADRKQIVRTFQSGVCA